jgi:hypothetical protein
MNAELVNNIKNWLGIDDEIKKLQKEIKNLRMKKKLFTQNLVTIMKDNDIDAFDINDGKLLYTKTNIKTPISKKHLIESVSKYFQGDEKRIQELCDFILNTREIKTKENIKRKIKK